MNLVQNLPSLTSLDLPLCPRTVCWPVRRRTVLRLCTQHPFIKPGRLEPLSNYALRRNLKIAIAARYMQ